jgi:putative hydrolase of the HAD superfamily
VRKPDPRIFALALGAMDMGAADAWFVGDHPMIDVRGARSAGLTAVWRGGTRPWPADDPPPDHAIAGLPDLLPLVG